MSLPRLRFTDGTEFSMTPTPIEDVAETVDPYDLPAPELIVSDDGVIETGPHRGNDIREYVTKWGDEIVLEPDTGAMKADGGKLPVHLLPIQPLIDVTEILEFGAEKYGPDNWRAGFKWSRTYSALMRHMFAWWRGEDKDQETGKSHLAHAMCNLLFLMEFENTHPELDDR